jgi:membrane associated rhomboid family serine protease
MGYRPYRRPGINPLWVLIVVNFVIFITNFVSQGSITARFGLNPAQLSQEWWTPFTYMFVHQDFFHLLFNMITLYFFGTFVISLVGETVFLTTYFVGGIIGGLAYALFSYIPVDYFEMTHWATVIGASGAIYALGGLLVVMRPNTRIYMFFAIPMPLWIAILIGFALVSFNPGVAWQAHLGGILYGAVVGYYYRKREYRRY